MSIAKRHIPTMELLGEYLTFIPTPKQVEAFAFDMRTLNPTLLRDSIKEAKSTNDLKKIANEEQRIIIHQIYNRKIKEFSALYPVVFAVENALRSNLADYLESYFSRMDWWVIIRDAVMDGKDHTDFTSGRIYGKPVTADFMKQAFFTIEKVLSVPQLRAKIHGRDKTDEFYYCLTIGELARIMSTDWTLIRKMFREDSVIGSSFNLSYFKSTMTKIRDARNEIYHSNPIKNRRSVFDACDRILNSLDFHLGDYDSALGRTQYKRFTSSVVRCGRHHIPALL